MEGLEAKLIEEAKKELDEEKEKSFKNAVRYRLNNLALMKRNIIEEEKKLSELTVDSVWAEYYGMSTLTPCVSPSR